MILNRFFKDLMQKKNVIHKTIPFVCLFLGKQQTLDNETGHLCASGDFS